MAERARQIACLVAVGALAGCATPPEVKRDYLEQSAWRGSGLTVIGRQQVVDAAAGAAPQTITLIDVDARAEVSGGAARRARVIERRVETVAAELERNGVAASDIGEASGYGLGGVQTYPPADLQAKRMVVIAHY